MNNMDLNVDDHALAEVVDFCSQHSLESTGIELYKVGGGRGRERKRWQ